MKQIEKQKALTLRRNGESIGVIAKKIGVSKSSVSFWVRAVKLSKIQRNKLNKRGFSVDAIEKRRINRIANQYQKRKIVIDGAKNDIKHISLEDLRLLGSMLYLGEGGKVLKNSFRMSNSDPDIIRIMMRFFREICYVPENKFRGHIHIHSHLSVENAELYWSRISGFPRTQFFKTYSKPSKASFQKKDNLPYGTFDVYVCDVKLFLRIMGWIEKIKELTLKK